MDGGKAAAEKYGERISQEIELTQRYVAELPEVCTSADDWERMYAPKRQEGHGKPSRTGTRPTTPGSQVLAGLEQSELARAADLHVSSIRRLERMAATPASSWHAAGSIVQALGASWR